MLKKIVIGAIVAFVLLSGLSQPLQAQESAIIQATATVIGALTIVGNSDLAFGTVTPGLNKAIDKATIGFAGEWQISGNAGAELSLLFTLPANLILIDSTVTMPISFSSTDASYDDGTGGGQTLPAGVINPLGPSAERLGATGTIRIWIGGTVAPGLTQTGGNYAADVTLTVAYTGS